MTEKTNGIAAYKGFDQDLNAEVSSLKSAKHISIKVR